MNVLLLTQFQPSVSGCMELKQQVSHNPAIMNGSLESVQCVSRGESCNIQHRQR